MWRRGSGVARWRWVTGAGVLFAAGWLALGLAPASAVRGAPQADEPGAPAAARGQPAGQAAASDPLAPLPAQAWTRAHAAHLLRRAGFGGPLAEVERLYALGPEGAVEALLAGFGGQEGPEFEAVCYDRPPRTALLALQAEQRQELVRQWRRADAAQLQRLRAWWLERMVRTPHPLREKMVLFWHGHFTSGYREVRSSWLLARQNALLRQHALGNFAELLRAIARDPAMLRYLDNDRNRKGRPNENFARELLELFTMGEGQYTEQDVKEAARALTGWTVRDGQFAFVARWHDDGPKRFLGREGRLGGEDILAIVLEQPVTARFVASKLFRFFTGSDPTPALAEALAATWRASDYELRPLLRRLFRARAFYAPEVMGNQVKSPVELVVGLMRALPLAPLPEAALPHLTARLGQELFQPPNVKGWPGGTAWITTSTLFERYNLAGALLGPLSAEAVRALRRAEAAMHAPPPPPLAGSGTGAGSRPASSRPGPPLASGADSGAGSAGARPRADRWRRGQRLLDLGAYARAHALETPEAALQHFTLLLLPRPLAPASRARLLEVLRGDRGGEAAVFDPSRPEVVARLEAALRLLVATPEFQLQ